MSWFGGDNSGTFLGKDKNWWFGKNSLYGRVTGHPYEPPQTNTSPEQKTYQNVAHGAMSALTENQMQNYNDDDTYTIFGDTAANPIRTNPAAAYMRGGSMPSTVQDWLGADNYNALSPELQDQANADYTRFSSIYAPYYDASNYYHNIVDNWAPTSGTDLAAQAWGNVQNNANLTSGKDLASQAFGRVQNTLNQYKQDLPSGQTLADQYWNDFQQKYQPYADQLNNATLQAADQARRNSNYSAQEQIKYANELAGGRDMAGSGLYYSLAQKSAADNARNYAQNVTDIYNANADRINQTVSTVLNNLQSQGMQIDAQTERDVFNAAMEAVMALEGQGMNIDAQNQQALLSALTQLESAGMGINNQNELAKLGLETNIPAFLYSLYGNTEVPQTI